MKRQSFFPNPKKMSAHNTAWFTTLGLDKPEGTYRRDGADWEKQHICRCDNFFVSVLESYSTRESVGYTRQEGYIKVNFWLSGRHSTILDGYGQHDHDRPEVLITSGPCDMVKVDLCNRETHMASVALCLQREFFPVHMDLDPDQLPEPLRGMLRPDGNSYAFFPLPLAPDLVAAARAILAAPPAVRQEPVYIEAKAVEMMCLLINRMKSDAGASVRRDLQGRQESRLYEARDFVSRHYAEPITLRQISRAAGLNKMALTDGFRQLFGISVYQCLQKTRMEHAYDLLQDNTVTIGQVATAVGYRHACNFSTAFHAYFGYKPQVFRAARS